MDRLGGLGWGCWEDEDGDVGRMRMGRSVGKVVIVWLEWRVHGWGRLV